MNGLLADKVVVADVNTDDGEQVAQSIRGDGGDAMFVRADVGLMTDVRALVDATVLHYGRLDVLALTTSLAVDLAPAIRVNAILPGAVLTGKPVSHTPKSIDLMARMCALKRVGEPEDIAQVALFLASSMSAYMTGESIVVDGGLTSIIQLPPGL